MKTLKRFLFGLTTMAMVCTSAGNDLHAGFVPGFGYVDAISAPELTPELAFLGLLVLSLLILSLQGNNNTHTGHA